MNLSSTIQILAIIFTLFGLYESNKILNKGDFSYSILCLALTFAADFMLLMMLIPVD